VGFDHSRHWHDRLCPRGAGPAPQLLRFARSQLRNDAWAEDAVSDTLLAALERPQAFAGAARS
jgi:hypothetical protein